MNTSSQTYWQIFNSAANAEKSGDIKNAEKLYDEALGLQHTYEALIGSAEMALKYGNHAKAAQRLEEAHRLQPSAHLLFRLGISLLESGNLDQALTYIKDGVTKRPKDFNLQNLYGVVLKRFDRLDEAIECFNKASKIDPKNVSSYINLGNTYLITEKFRKAAEQFSKAIKIDPKSGEYRRLLACTHINAGENEKAVPILHQALSLSPKDPRILMDLCGVYYNMKEFEKGLQEITKALEFNPGNVDLLRMKASILRKLGQNEQAIEIYHLILKNFPNDVKTLTNLGNLYYYALGDRQRANQCYAYALNIEPGNTEVLMQYCECLRNSRYGSEAEHLEKAYEISKMLLDKAAFPEKIASAVQSVFLRTADYESLNKLGDRKTLLKYWLDKMNIGELHNQLGRVETMEDRLELVQYHIEWGKKIEEMANKNPIEKAPAIRTRNKIRVGIMSSDLRHHPVTYFAQPIFENYDRSKFEIYCYSFFNNQPDQVQQQITRIVDKFSVTPNLPDREIAKLIAADELDILFELGGTTHMNKVELLAYRPAPIQASWLGYPHSCGLSAIDYILVDPYIKPEQPGLLIEKPFIMPESWVSLGGLGFFDIPITEGIPENHKGYLTFGTMNNPYKYSPKMYEVWAKIMNQVEGSRLLFVRPEGAVKYFKENLLNIFASHGIANDRIELLPIRGQHMQHYNKIDIALDPFPHTGGTTTCESLWMGVPVITLVGPAFFERLSYSNLSNAGLGEFCAFSIDEYIQKAVALAQNKELRESLRHGLRKQIMNSPLGQTQRFVRNFEAQIMEVLS